MTSSYTFHAGTTPLLISMPHDGRQLPEDIAASMTGAGRSLPDTDWHVVRLYEFAGELGASMISANYARYVVDLNRPSDDAALYAGELVTGLCPTRTFDRRAIYSHDAAIDVDARIRQYWRPYHDKLHSTLAELRDAFGYALLWDAHSIASRVPSLFDGQLPVLNVGTWDGRSCGQEIAAAVMQVAESSSHDAVLNGRFKGGHITRHYGKPDNNIHAIQLEIAQRAYMDELTTSFEENAASQLRDTLRAMLEAFIKTAAGNVGILAR